MVKNGRRRAGQLYRCKDCRHQFYDNGKLARMRKPTTTVAAAFRLYFDGASLRKVGRSLRGILGAGAGHSSIWRWTTKYVPQVDGFLRNFTPHLSGIWHVDETLCGSGRPDRPARGRRTITFGDLAKIGGSGMPSTEGPGLWWARESPRRGHSRRVWPS